MKSARLLCILLLLTVFPLPAATPDEGQIDVQRQKIAALERKIAAEEQAMAKLGKDRSATEERARRLGTQVENRNRLLAETEGQARRLRAQIAQRDSVAGDLAVTLARNRAQYAAMVRDAYRNYKNNNYLTYLFASRDFADVARKITELRAVGNMRAHKVEQITTLSAQVAEEQRQLVRRKRALDSVTRSLTGQKQKLERDVRDARASVGRLTKQQQDALKRKREQERELAVAVDELRALTKGNTTGASFSSKTTGLRLPVAGGRVIRYKENMAEIGGAKGANVTAIYDGKVVDIRQNRITDKYEVYVAHGEYFSSYANMESVRVVKGQLVARNEVLGTIGLVVDPITFATAYDLFFSINAPSPKEKLRAETFFKK